MKNYKSYIINKLLDSYEDSAIYKGTVKRELSIFFKFNPKNIKEYFSETDFLPKEYIDNGCNELEEKHLIKVYRGKGFESHIIKKVALNLENLEKCYEYVNRKEKQNKEEETIAVIELYTNRNDLLGEFSRYIKLRLEEKSSIKKYLDIDNLQETKDILKGIDYILIQKEEIFKRVFSVRVYSDSKKFEVLENKIEKIIKEFDENFYISDYNIIKNYTYVYLKGNMEIKTKDNTIDLNEFKGGIALSSKDIENIVAVKVNSDKLITIENLTSFNNFSSKDTALVYLGGYHNSVRRELLNRIYKDNKEVLYYHFGDIDAGGFKIFKHLKEKTNIPFSPYNMDKVTLLNNYDFCKMLTDNDIKTLNAMGDLEEFYVFHEVIEIMLRYRIKLEQEIV